MILFAPTRFAESVLIEIHRPQSAKDLSYDFAVKLYYMINTTLGLMTFVSRVRATENTAVVQGLINCWFGVRTSTHAFS